jgi:hypothetical protein
VIYQGLKVMMFKHVGYLKMNLMMTGVYKVEIMLTRNLCPCLRVTRTDSGWKWTKNDNTPIIYSFSENSGVCQQLSSKYDSESPSELAIFLEYMDPLFSVISKETNDYADEQLQIQQEKKEKTMICGFQLLKTK